MTQRYLPTVTAVLIFIAARSLAFAESGRPPAILRIVEHTVAAIPVGADPSLNVSDAPCPPEGSCEAGVAAVSESGDIYFYDYDHQNVKVISAAGLSVLPGRKGAGKPIDMAVTDNTVFLLYDAWRQDGDRFRIYACSREDTAWTRLPFLGPEALGTATIPGVVDQPVPMANTASIYCGRDQVLYVYDRVENRSYPVGTEAATLPPSEQLARSFEGLMGPAGVTFMPTESGTLFPQTGVQVKSNGHPLGLDRYGRLYVQAPSPIGSTYIAYDQTGRLIAESTRPTRANLKLVRGQGPLLVDPTGGLIELQARAEQLLITRWVVE